MKRLPLALLLPLCLLVFSLFTYQNVGISTRCVNEDCVVRAASSPFYIGFGVLFFVAIFLIPRQSFNITTSQASFSRRLGALFFDVYLFDVSFRALFMLFPLVTEFFYTGSFHWEFTRSFTRITDSIVGVGAVMLQLALLFYWRYQVNKRQKSTFGQNIMGYAVQDGRTQTHKAKPHDQNI